MDLLADISARARDSSIAWQTALAIEFPDPEGTRSEEQFNKIISDCAWLDRDAARPILYSAEAIREEARETDEVVARRIAFEATAQRYRYDFKFRALDSLVREHRATPHTSNLTDVFGAFALLGRRSPAARRSVDTVMQAGTATSTLAENAVGRYILLHGLWFGTHLDDQAELMITLSDYMEDRAEESANLYYWRAYALRRSGKHEEALDSIDTALDLHDPTMINVHQDYVRERELIGTMSMVERTIAQSLEEGLAESRQLLEAGVRESSEKIEQESRETRGTIQSSLLGVIEILGLFLAVATFVGGTAFAILSARTFAQLITGASVLLVGSIVFFVLLRLIVGIPLARRSRRRGQRKAGSRSP